MFVKRDLAAWFGRRNDRTVPRNKNAKGSTKIVGKHEGNSMGQFFRRELATMAARAPSYSSLSILRRAPLLVALILSALACHAADQAIGGARGIVATIDQKSGRYEVRSRELNWTFAGQLGDSASNLSIKKGQDRLGAYRELRFSWRQQVTLHGSIRTYVNRPVVLFSITAIEPISDAAAMRFPRFTEFPKDLHHFSYKNDLFAPRKFCTRGNRNAMAPVQRSDAGRRVVARGELHDRENAWGRDHGDRQRPQ